MALGANDTQYDKFKTPFFRVSVANARGQNKTELPPSLAGLIEKVEITETMAGCNITSQFSIVFKEGSREPFRKSIGTSAQSLYTDAELTNATGMLTDLKFASLAGGSVGFSAVVANAVGAATDVAAAATDSIGQVSGILSGAAPENKTIISDDTVPQKVTYVFQERNLVEIKWGYLEDPTNQRTIKGNIMMVQSDFPESGHPQTTVTCAGPGSWLDQITTINPIYFKEDSIAGFDVTSGPLFTFQDMDMESTIKKLFPGFKIIISKNLLSEKVDKYHSKVLPSGKSPEQFLRELKRANNAMYISYYSPKDGKPVIAYISRNDFQKKEIIPNRSLFTYKAPGSILKSISVKAEFNGLSGAGMVGVGSDGTITKAYASNGQVAETLYEGKSIIDTNPASGNKIPEAEGINNGVFGNGKLAIGKVEMSPSADDPQTLKDTAQSLAACRSRLVYLEFSCQGFSKLTTGTVYFGGIGNRYSGQYEVLTVTHVLDTNGYNCRGTAQAGLIDGSSGVKPAQAQEGQPSTTDVQLFQGASNFQVTSPSEIGSALADIATGGNAMDEYLEDIYA